MLLTLGEYPNRPWCSLSVPAVHLLCAVEVRAIPKQSLVSLRYLSVPVMSVACAALVLVVPGQPLVLLAAVAIVVFGAQS